MLRIGILLDSLESSAWVEYILREIQHSDYARIELVVLNTPELPKALSLQQRLEAYWKRGLYSRYEEWDYSRNQVPNDYRRPRKLAPLLDNIPQRIVSPQRKGFSDYFEVEDVKAIREADLDVILRFGFRILRGEVLDSARYGIWSYHHGDNRHYRGGPPLFWEVYENNPVSGTILQVLTSSLDAGKVLYRSHSATNNRSLYRSRNPIYWKTAEFMLRRLMGLDRSGWTYIENLATYNEPNPQGRIYKTPHAGQMAKFLAGQVGRAVRASFQSRTQGAYVQWFLALRRRQGLHFSSSDGYKVLAVPDDRFYADPKLFERDGRTWLFFEDYRYQEKRALISCCELAEDGTLGKPFEVLRRPYHLSYPFVFEQDGVVYMIPETRENKAVELYKAKNFPHDWEFERALLDDVAAVDATIYQDQGKRFWMFVGLSSGRFSTCDELGLYFADTLNGPWHPHPMSPVVSDVRQARPAGALFFDEGRLLRPSQDCAKAYGYALNFSEVRTLTVTEYEERIIGQIGPRWHPGNLGTHAYSQSSTFEVIDGNRQKKLP